MTFIVTLLALSIERFFDWTNIRKWSWYAAYQQALVTRLSNHAPYLVLAAIIIPVVLAVNVISFIISGWLYGFASLLFQLGVLIYCLGPQNLWADTFVTMNSLEDRATNLHSSEAMHRDFTNHIFISANSRIFAVLFWFMVLGPAGAVLYRTISLSAAEFKKQNAKPVLIQSTRMLEASLDWLPIRVLTFFFALGGHFTKVFSSWRKKMTSGLDSNDLFITECGAAALGDEQTIAIDGSAEKNAIALLDRAFVISLVFIAICAIWL